MKTVKVTPDNIISIINVDFDDFRDLQKAVGGHFETVSTKTLYETFKMPMIMLVDEDGIMKQKEVNRLGSYFYDADRHGWPILGDIVFAIAAGEDIEAPDDAEALMVMRFQRLVTMHPKQRQKLRRKRAVVMAMGWYI